MSFFRVLLFVIGKRRLSAFGMIAVITMASLAEGTGIAFIVPILEILSNGGSVTPESEVSKAIANGFGWVNIPYALWTVMLMGFLLFGFQSIMKYFRLSLTAKISEQVAAEMRVKLFGNLLKTDLGYLQRRKGGDFINSLVTECNRVQVTFLSALELLALVIETSLYLVIAFVLSWQLVLGAMLLIGVIVLLLKFELNRAGSLGNRLTEINNSLQNTVIEHLGGIRILRAFNLEARSYDTFKEQADEFPRVRYSVAKSRARLSTLYETGMVAGLLIVVFYSVTVIHMSMAVLLTFILVLYRFYPKVGAMNKAAHQTLFSLPGVRNVIEMTNETEHPSIKSGSKQLESFQNEIRFDSVGFAYDGDSTVLNGIDLKINRGETVAVIGGSGAGKTTLVNMLMRFYDPTSGRITVDGTDLRELDISSWRGAIALVNQDTFLFHDTIRNNIAMGKPGATDEEIVSAAKRAYADEFINSLPEGYDTLVGDRGMRLSGGQRQRLALARAVVRDPQILILDEATSELDSRSEDLIRQAVEDLGTERTIFIIAHRLSTIRHADKIVVLDHGKVIEEGTHASLLSNGEHYAEFLKLQNLAAPTLQAEIVPQGD
jgi:ABC-type multidrug transport system fused ATPase/permease subunit